MKRKAEKLVVAVLVAPLVLFLIIAISNSAIYSYAINSSCGLNFFFRLMLACGSFMKKYFLLYLIFLYLLAIVFWIRMLIDCIKRDFPESVNKLVWVLVLIFLNFIGAILYYFFVKRQGSPS